ncbi:TRAP type immunogenic protein [Bacillus freudenreichii]|nr:TRAP type immunogenic protein [Bacillus freudenreichii]
MKKFVSVLVLGLFSLLMLAGCGGATSSEKAGKSESDKAAKAGALPPQMTWSTYDVGASGYTEMSAIANMLTNEYNSQIRMLPSATGVGRMIPLQKGAASVAKLGDESQFAFEGVEEFAQKEWGPQNLRAVWSPITQYGFGVRAKEGIDKIQDLKGKKIPHFPGNSSINVKTEALLAFGGLTWDDVQKVELTSYGSQSDALIQGKIDAVSGIPASSTFFETDSKGGIEWVEMDPADKEGWEDLNQVAPWLFPETRDDGAGMKGDTPLMGYGYSLVSYADQEDIKELLIAMDENFDQFKDAFPGAHLYAKENVLTEPRGIPFHEDTVEFFKENGLWDDEKQAKNDELVKRAEQLEVAWKQSVEEAKEKGISDSEYTEYWLKRKTELVK